MIHPTEALLVNKNRDHQSYPKGVYIGRPHRESKEYKSGHHYGNPFSHMSITGCVQVSTRDAAVRRYRDWLTGENNLLYSNDWSGLEPKRSKWILMQILRGDLYQKVLICWCAPLLCHGSVLIDLSNEARKDQRSFAQKYLNLVWQD